MLLSHPARYLPSSDLHARTYLPTHPVRRSSCPWKWVALAGDVANVKAASKGALAGMWYVVCGMCQAVEVLGGGILLEGSEALSRIGNDVYILFVLDDWIGGVQIPRSTSSLSPEIPIKSDMIKRCALSHNRHNVPILHRT